MLRPSFSQAFQPTFARRFDPILNHRRRSNTSNLRTHGHSTKVFIDASILYNIVRKSQGKSVSLYLLMNINDLGAMHEFCSLKYLIFVETSILQNIARKSQEKPVSSCLLMNVTK